MMSNSRETQETTSMKKCEYRHYRSILNVHDENPVWQLVNISNVRTYIEELFFEPSMQPSTSIFRGQNIDVILDVVGF